MHALAAAAGRSLELDSAGTGSWHVGEPADPRARRAAKRRGYAIHHIARQFTAADLARFDLVLAMDRQNLADLQRIAGGRAAHAVRMELFRRYDPDGTGDADVPDPYTDGPRGFEDVLDICERACRNLLQTL